MDKRIMVGLFGNSVRPVIEGSPFDLRDVRRVAFRSGRASRERIRNVVGCRNLRTTGFRGLGE